ncbi:MAG: 2Fe-2S iron-sulfur cluster binding domain-containing protein [Acidobacteriota bacterium]
MFKRLFKRQPRPTYNFEVLPQGQVLEIDDRSTLLDAALDAGLPFPYGCQAGECGACVCRLVTGQLKFEMDTSHLISPGQKQAGYVLACQSKAESDVVVEIPDLPAHSVVQTAGKVAAVRELTHDILEMTVALDSPMAYTAGQYAEIVVPGHVEEGRNYSFGSAPGDGPVDSLVFHVRHVPGGAFTGWLHDADRTGAALSLTGPHGQFALRSGDDPILCVAGGSGMAPIQAVLEQAAADGVQRDVVFFFGARAQRDLYSLDVMERIAADWPARFHFEPVLSEEPEGSDWSGARGLVTDRLASLGDDLPRHQAYLCGPPGMIDAALEILEGAGLGADRIFYDKFTDRRHVPPS